MAHPIEDFHPRVQAARTKLLKPFGFFDGTTLGVPVREQDASQSGFRWSQIWLMYYPLGIITIVYGVQSDQLAVYTQTDEIHAGEVSQAMNAAPTTS